MWLDRPFDRKAPEMNPHGIMFHHFFDVKHSPRQGAISGDQLSEMIEHLGTGRILSAKEWLERSLNGMLNDEHVCFTFDDALLCQYDIAAPVLRKYGITGFWFVYSSVCSGSIEMLEVYTKFRAVAFGDVEDFYTAFFATVERSDLGDLVTPALEGFDPLTYLSEFPFYSLGDRKFRYTRDRILGPDRYDEVMRLMLREHGIDIETFAKGLWMREHHLKRLHEEDHVVGLHSHSHPTTLGAFPESQQRAEYQTNFRILSDILGESPTTMSHPCNSYNEVTLWILREMGIGLGFCSNMSKPLLSELEYPREDHANVIKGMEK